MAIAWKIHYTDGSAFSSDDGTPWDAPRRNVLAIIVPDTGDPPYRVIYGTDYYYYEKDLGGWRQCDIFTMWEHLMRARHPLIIFGKMVRDDDWPKQLRRIRKCADEDFARE